MEQITAIIAIIILGAVLVAREYFSWKERADLYDRLMSRDIKDYKEFTDKPEQNQYETVPDPRFIPIEQAEEEILNG